MREAAGEDVFETTEYQGSTIYSVEDAGDLVSFMIADDFAVVGMGDSGARQLRDWLSARSAAVRVGEAKMDLPKGVKDRMAHAPEGWDSLYGLRFVPLLGIIEKADDEIPAMARRILDTLTKAVAKYDLDDVVGASAWRGKRAFSSRTLW